MKAGVSVRDQFELWLVLLFLNALGWSFGLILTGLLVGTVEFALDSFISLVVAGILGGLLISLLSLFVLRDRVRGAGAWILSTCLGWTLGILATVYSLQVLSSAIGWMIAGAIGGLIFGYVQRYGFEANRGSGILWTGLNGLGWALAYVLGHAFPSDLSLEHIAAMNLPIAQGMLGWVMLGTLAILVLILVFATLKRGDRGPRVQWWP